jgi:hypothetical protein
VKLFQIEEPEGGPSDPGAPGAAVAIDISGECAEVAFSVGGNAVVLADREGFEQVLEVPSMTAGAAAWQALFEGARIRAERTLARPVTHAVIVVAAPPDPGIAECAREAAQQAGLEPLQLATAAELPAAPSAALAAALLAEDLAPRPEIGIPSPTDSR